MSTKKAEKKLLLYKNWSQGFVMVRDFYFSQAKRLGLKKTNKDMQAYLELSEKRFDYLRAGNWPKADEMQILHEKLGFSFSWLVTGEGDPFAETASSLAVEKEIVLLREQVIDLQSQLVAAQKEIISLLKNNQEENGNN